MRLYGMDSIMIDIYNIRNIESINVYDIVSPGSSELDIIPSMLVIYDGGKTINLCSRDKYFDTFVRKVIEVYNDEKNDILEDSLTDPFRLRKSIQVDERTKTILENGNLTSTNDLYKFYSRKKKYDWSLLFKGDKFKMILPIIKYHLNELFSMTDRNVQFNDKLNGYSNIYMLEGSINGIFKYFPIKFDEISDNEYSIEIGGLLENNKTICMNIGFFKDRITVSVSTSGYDIKGEFTYFTSTNSIKSVESIKRDNILVHYRNADLPEISNPYKSITDFDQDTNLKWFKLPWGAIYGTSSNISELGENEKIVEIYNMYVDNITAHSFTKRQYFSRNYVRNGVVSNFGSTISLDEAVKNTVGICLNEKDGIYLIETSFLDTMHTNGYYDENLKNKYFYHLMHSSSIRDIDKEMLVNIGKEDGILEESDILNDSLVLKLVRGK